MDSGYGEDTLLTASLLGILSALFSAVSWGGGDFSGGYASRRSLPFQVLIASGAISLIIFLFSALIIGEPFPTTPSLVWATLAGIAGALGLGALYQGLAQGQRGDCLSDCGSAWGIDSGGIQRTIRGLAATGAFGGHLSWGFGNRVGQPDWF